MLLFDSVLVNDVGKGRRNPRYRTARLPEETSRMNADDGDVLR